MYSQLPRYHKARGSSTGFSRFSPTKVEAHIEERLYEYEIWTHRARVQENLRLIPDKHEPVIVMCKN